jgi:predicted O-methyltransferase YrrM
VTAAPGATAVAGGTKPVPSPSARLAWKLDAAYLGARVRRLARFLEADPQPLVAYAHEYFEEAGGSAWGNPNLELYLLVRAQRPQHVVETGVNRGISTAAILRALHANGAGDLVSIDLPTTDRTGRIDSDGRWDGSYVPSGRTGLEIPEYLRDRWTLRLGPSRDLLPPLTGYDLFFHDSDHAYANQAFEYRTATEHLAPHGILASDDILWSAAFAEASRGHRRTTWPLLRTRRGAFFVP